MFEQRLSQEHRPSVYLGTSLVLAFVLTFLLVRTPSAVHAAPTGDVCGQIIINTTWIAANNPYTVTCDIRVLPGVTLTIQSGVVVKFTAGTSLRVDGTLIAQDATFTSVKANPAKGDWGHIFFTTTSVDAVFDANGNYVSGSLIQDSLIEWGGGGAGVNGAIETASASPFIDQNTIQNNADSGIHAVARSAGQPIKVSRNSVSGNDFGINGGGIYVSYGNVVSNTVVGNRCTIGTGSQGGGGIYANTSTLIGNAVTQNTAFGTKGGGIYATGSILMNNTVDGNSANDQGGGIYATGGTLFGNSVTGNTTSGGGGGGIFASSGTITGNLVSGNAINGINAFGGGIYASLSTLTNNVVTNNTAKNDVGEARGGGIFASGSTVTSNTVTGNTTTAPSLNYNGLGGGIYADGGTIANNTVNNNIAAGGKDSVGGGIYGNLNTLQQNTLIGNNANRGGGLYSYKGTTTDNTILSNTTTLSGTLYSDEGTATGNTVSGNIANYGGGCTGSKPT